MLLGNIFQYSVTWGRSWFYKNVAINKNAIPIGRNPEKTSAKQAQNISDEISMLVNNDTTTASLIRTAVTATIGEGLLVKFESEDKELNKAVKKHIKIACEKKNCTLNEMHSMRGAERLMASEWEKNGGFIIRHHYKKSKKRFYCFEIIPVSSIDKAKNDYKKGLYNGIKTDQNGKITGLWLFKKDDTTSEFINKNFTICVDVWQSPKQYTPISRLVSILKAIDNIGGYENSEIKSAKKRADKSVIIATDVYSTVLDAQKKFIEQQVASNDITLEEGQELYSEMISNFIPSEIHENATPITKDSTVYDLKGQNDSVYDSLTNNNQRIISKATGFSPSSVFGIQESSYNTSLKNQQNDDKSGEIRAQDLIDGAIKEIYQKILEAGHILGKYNLKNYYQDPDEWNYYLSVFRKKNPHIDPIKHYNGMAKLMELGGTSQEIIAEELGRNSDDIIADQVNYEAKLYEARKNAGILNKEENK